MNKYSLRYLCQLDNSIHHRSRNTFCTRFRKDLDFWICYGFPTLFSVWAKYMQKLDASTKTKDNDTRTAFVSDMSD